MPTPKILALAAALALLTLSTPGLRAELGYVGCSSSDDAYPFDLDSFVVGEAVEILPEGDYPYDAVINFSGDEVWICGASGDGVAVIDRASGIVTQRIATGEYAVSIAFSADGALALVSCRDSDRVDVVDTASYTVTSSLPIPNNYLGPGNLALDPVSGNFYLVEWYDDTFYEIAPDGSEILRTQGIGVSLWNPLVDPDGNWLYLTDRGTDEVYVLDRESFAFITVATVGEDPWAIDITVDAAKLMVVCEDSQQMVFFDLVGGLPSLPGRFLNLPADSAPRDLDIFDQGGWTFVTSGNISGPDGVFVVDNSSEALLTLIEVPGGNPNVLAVQPQMGGNLTAVQPTLPAPSLELICHPNPFNPKAWIRYRLAAAGPVTLTVHDAEGRLLRRLESGWREAGVHESVWDGSDAAGRSQASGIYLLSLKAGVEQVSQRLVLVK